MPTPPSDALTELVFDYFVHSEALMESALDLVSIEDTAAQAGEHLHQWLRDSAPDSGDPTLFSDLAVLALGLVNWPRLAGMVSPTEYVSTEPDETVVISLPPSTSGNVPAHT